MPENAPPSRMRSARKTKQVTNWRCVKPEGSVYTGELVDDEDGGCKRWGHGTLQECDGSSYVGDWANDIRHGEGVFKNIIGDSFKGTYVHGLKEGQGRETTWKGEVYEGQFMNGLRHGHGECTLWNRDVFTGTWTSGEVVGGEGTRKYVRGGSYFGQWARARRTKHAQEPTLMRSGRGRLTEACGDVYEGEWEHDEMKQGAVASIMYTNGDKYVGEFSMQLKNGDGAQYYNEGRTYKGQWENGTWHGTGELREANGDGFYGNFVNGVRMGKDPDARAVLIRPDGIYRGMINQNSIPDGAGEMAFKNGDAYAGNFDNGERTGSGKIVLSSGEVYEGEWWHDQRHGWGTVTYANGDRFTGQWEFNMRNGAPAGVDETMVITQETQFNVPVSAALMKRIGKGNVVLKEEVLVEEEGPPEEAAGPTFAAIGLEQATRKREKPVFCPPVSSLNSSLREELAYRQRQEARALAEASRTEIGESEV